MPSCWPWSRRRSRCTRSPSFRAASRWVPPCSLPEKDRYTQGKRKLLGMLTGLMGGRAAEELACRDITTGASNDLKQATRIAHLMVCEWGMSDVLGPQSFGDNQEEMLFMGREVSRNQDYSEATAQKIDQEVNRMLTEAYQQAY
jgi:cell division protease FtsH